MANLVRQEPREVMSLRSAMDRLFDESFLPGFGNGGQAGPALDMCETNDSVIVTAAVPGIKPEALKVTLTGDVLEISGEMQADEERQEAQYHLRERRYGSFSRVVTLPTAVDPNKVTAEFENGVVKLTMPKAEAARRKTITVKPKK